MSYARGCQNIRCQMVDANLWSPKCPVPKRLLPNIGCQNLWQESMGSKAWAAKLLKWITPKKKEHKQTTKLLFVWYLDWRLLYSLNYSRFQFIIKKIAMPFFMGFIHIQIRYGIKNLKFLLSPMDLYCNNGPWWCWLFHLRSDFK